MSGWRFAKTDCVALKKKLSRPRRQNRAPKKHFQESKYQLNLRHNFLNTLHDATHTPASYEDCFCLSLLSDLELCATKLLQRPLFSTYAKKQNLLSTAIQFL